MDVRSCVGCGFCCRKALCGVALRIWGKGVEKCPALAWDGKRYWCDLCRKPGQMGEDYRKELYVGDGCCCGLNSDRRNIPPPEEKVQEYRLQPETALLLRCLAAQFCSQDAIYLALLMAEKKLGPEFTIASLNVLKEGRPGYVDSFMGSF